MNTIKNAKIEVSSDFIYITKDEATLTIKIESPFWKNEENRNTMYAIYPELKKKLQD